MGGKRLVNQLHGTGFRKEGAFFLEESFKQRNPATQNFASGVGVFHVRQLCPGRKSTTEMIIN